jgi:hypothetical protein
MARKTNTSAVEAYIDAALATANDERSRAGSVGRSRAAEDVSLTVIATLRASLGREIRRYGGTALLALLPILVIGARAGLSALPQLGIATDGWLPWAVQGITIAAAVWAALVALWQARNSWRRALGRAPATFRFGRKLTGHDMPNQGMPNLEEMAIKLGVALAALPALLWLALSGSSDPLWLLGVLVALPPLFLFGSLALLSSLSGLGAAGGVNASAIEPLPISSPQVAQLDDRIAQLQQIRVWLKDDKLKSMIDDVIGKQVAKSERRQVAYSVVVGVLSLLAGWLLSAISPISTLAQLLPR